jgi:phosphonate transport system substrate-binding protein
MPWKRFGLVALLLGLALLAAGGARADGGLVFGVLNQQSPALTAERWNPILGHLSRVTGVPLKLRMGPTVERTNAMMADGEFDLVFANHNFKPEYDALGFRVIARWGGEAARAAIVVLGDSALTGLSQLADRRVAFPSPHAFLGHAVPSVALAKAQVSVE